MGQEYKTMTIETGHGDDRHTQEYVTLADVTEEQIRSGDDTGVVCLVLKPGYGAVLADILNDKRAVLAA